MKDKKFGCWEVSDYGMSYYVGSCSLEDEDIDNLEKALQELKKRRKKLKNG